MGEIRVNLIKIYKLYTCIKMQYFKNKNDKI